MDEDPRVHISIHALLGELRLKHEISIHALREEGDMRGLMGRLVSRRFLSTPSARRATVFAL